MPNFLPTNQGFRFFKLFALVHTSLPKKKSMFSVFPVKHRILELFSAKSCKNEGTWASGPSFSESSCKNNTDDPIYGVPGPTRQLSR